MRKLDPWGSRSGKSQVLQMRPMSVAFFVASRNRQVGPCELACGTKIFRGRSSGADSRDSAPLSPRPALPASAGTCAVILPDMRNGGGHRLPSTSGGRAGDLELEIGLSGDTSSAPSLHSCRWRRYGHQLVANMRGDLRLEVLVNDRACEAHSTYAWAGGGMVLTISTVLPQRDLAVELISTYVGHPHTRTIVTH